MTAQSGAVDTRVCGSATVEQLSRSLTRTDLAKMQNSRLE